MGLAYKSSFFQLMLFFELSFDSRMDSFTIVIFLLTLQCTSLYQNTIAEELYDDLYSDSEQFTYRENQKGQAAFQGNQKQAANQANQQQGFNQDNKQQGQAASQVNQQGASQWNQQGQGAYQGNQQGQGAYQGNQQGQGAYQGNQQGHGAYQGNQQGQGANQGYQQGQGTYQGNQQRQGAHQRGQGAYQWNQQGAYQGNQQGQGAYQWNQQQGQGAYQGNAYDQLSPFQYGSLPYNQPNNYYGYQAGDQGAPPEGSSDPFIFTLKTLNFTKTSITYAMCLSSSCPEDIVLN